MACQRIANTHVLALQYSAQLLEILPRHDANVHLRRCLQRDRNGGIITKHVYTSFMNFDSETFFFPNYIKEIQVVVFLDSRSESFVIEILLSFLYI